MKIIMLNIKIKVKRKDKDEDCGVSVTVNGMHNIFQYSCIFIICFSYLFFIIIIIFFFFGNFILFNIYFITILSINIKVLWYKVLANSRNNNINIIIIPIPTGYLCARHSQSNTHTCFVLIFFFSQRKQMKVDPLERSKWSARGAGGSVLLGSGSEFAPRPGQQKCNESEKKQRPDYLKQIQNCRSQQHKWCVRQVNVCVEVFVCVWCGCSWQQRVMCCQPVDDVADAATASGARQAATAAEREETEKEREGEEWRGEALGCQRVSPLAAYIGWAALEHNFQEIRQYLTSRHCRCHCALPVFHFFLSL